MVAWFLRRLLQAALVVLAMTALVFVGIHVIGNPIDVLIAPDASAAERTRAIAALGLDQPLWRQYLTFLANAAHGDLGRSFAYAVPSLQLIAQRAPATLELAAGATLVSVVIGVPLGLYVGMHPEARLSRAIMAGSILCFSLPTFWVGLMLILVFAVALGALPASGRGATVDVFGVGWSFLTHDGRRHLALPMLNLALYNIALVLRLTRAGVRETVPMEFVRFARAKGLSEGRVVGVHILRNILVPIVTVVGLEFGGIVAFAIVTETVFAWPGMGKLIVDSIFVLDRPVIVAYLMAIVLLFVTINFVVDLLYVLLDPRARPA